MTATFRKLLQIKIVARSRCGVFNNLSILRSALLSFSSSLSIVCGSSEKNATSEAEMIAEKLSIIILTANETIADIVTECIVIPLNALYKKSFPNEIKFETNREIRFLFVQK